MSETRPALDVRELPTVTFGPSGTVWWGTLGFAGIETFTMILCFVAYLYLRRVSPAWPPEGTSPPELIIPTINMVIALVALGVTIWLDRQARKLNRRNIVIGLVTTTLLAIVLTVLRWYEFESLNTRWDTHAYGSVLWTVLGFHTAILLAEVGETIGITAIFLTGRDEANHYPHVSDTSLFWYFMIGIWVPMYVLLYLVPRWS